MILKFPEAKGKYWYLYHIAGIRKDNVVQLHFANAIFPNDNYYRNKDTWNTIHIISHSAACLYSLNEGAIYDVIKNVIIYPEKYVSAKNAIIITHPEGYSISKRELPFIDSEFYPIKHSKPLLDFHHFIYNYRYYDKYNKDNKNQDLRVFLSTYAFYKHLIFVSEPIIQSFLKNKIFDIFDLESINITYDENSNEAIGNVNYNGNLLAYEEAKYLSVYLFLEENKGIIFYEYLYNYLSNELINKEKINDNIKTSYLDIKLPFSGTLNVKLRGKHLKKIIPNLKDKDNDKKEEKYFYGYDIVSIKRNDGTPLFNVTKVNLIDTSDLFARIQEDENSMTIRSGIKTSNLKGNIGNINGGASNPYSDGLVLDKVINSSLFEGIEFNNLKPDNIGKRMDDYLPTLPVKYLNGLTSDIQTEDENSKNEKLLNRSSFTHTGAFTYIYKIALYLSVNYDIDYSFDTLDISINENVYYEISDYKLALLELTYRNKYYYLIEFTFGNTGFFYGENKNKLSKEILSLIADEFIDLAESRKKGKQLWSWIVNNSKSFAIEQNIVLKAGIDHTSGKFLDNIIKSDGDRIYKDRILKAN